jgi:hypothetical protein
MPDSAFYVLEKLFQAVNTLVSEAGSVQERLMTASGHFWPARPNDIPYEDLRRVFVGIRDDLSFQPAEGKEGQIAATMKITNDQDASAIARRILNLYIDLGDRLRAPPEK